MEQLVLHDPLVSELREIAERENISVEGWIAEAMKRARWEGQRKKIHEESEWWYAQPSERRKKFSKFVAVHHKEVVDSDDEEQSLINRIRQKYGKTAVLITPSEERREIRVVSFRIEKK